MDRQRNFFDFDDENFMYVIMLVFLQLRHQEETDKMLRELDKELRLSNRFFPDSKLVLYQVRNHKIIGYSFLSLHLASSEENLQRTVEQMEFLYIAHALTWRCIVSKEDKA